MSGNCFRAWWGYTYTLTPTHNMRQCVCRNLNKKVYTLVAPYYFPLRLGRFYLGTTHHWIIVFGFGFANSEHSECFILCFVLLLTTLSHYFDKWHFHLSRFRRAGTWRTGTRAWWYNSYGANRSAGASSKVPCKCYQCASHYFKVWQVY